MALLLHKKPDVKHEKGKPFRKDGTQSHKAKKTVKSLNIGWVTMENKKTDSLKRLTHLPKHLYSNIHFLFLSPNLMPNNSNLFLFVLLSYISAFAISCFRSKKIYY